MHKMWLACFSWPANQGTALHKVQEKEKENQMKKLLMSLNAALLLTGCGTICTRYPGGSDGVGARPYEAVVQDAVICKSVEGCAMGILSMPVDIALDTVLLPVDLIAWPYGCKKQPAWDFTADWWH